MALSVISVSCKKEAPSFKIDPNVPNTEAKTDAHDHGFPSGRRTPAVPKRVPPKDGKYPKIAFDNSEFDFGKIKSGDKVETTFTFTNTGEADLIISNAVGSCGCTVPEYPKEPLKPGAKGAVKVSFNSAGKHGVQSKTVTLTTNTEAGQEKLVIKSSIE